MENPSQSHFTIEELFMLKPEIIEEAITKADASVLAAAATDEIAISVLQEQPIKNAFWPKNKWYVIGGGFILVAGTLWFIYNQRQKKKKNIQKN